MAQLINVVRGSETGDRGQLEKLATSVEALLSRCLVARPALDAWVLEHMAGFGPDHAEEWWSGAEMMC